MTDPTKFSRESVGVPPVVASPELDGGVVVMVMGGKAGLVEFGGIEDEVPEAGGTAPPRRTGWAVAGVVGVVGVGTEVWVNPKLRHKK